jgi:hypothetical protein
MMAEETVALAGMPAHVRKLLGDADGSTYNSQLAAHNFDRAGLTRSAELSQVPLLPEDLLAQKHLFPEGQLDQDLQQIDLRDRNSWRLLLAEVPTVEFLEVYLVNATAPFVFNARQALMLRRRTATKHCQRSAVEGQFYRRSHDTSART